MNEQELRDEAVELLTYPENRGSPCSSSTFTSSAIRSTLIKACMDHKFGLYAGQAFSPG